MPTSTDGIRPPDPVPRGRSAAFGAAGAPGPGPDLDDVVRRLRAAGCVFAEEEAALLRAATTDPAERDAWCRRREAGEPLEQIVGWVDFAGDRYRLGPGVFVPRRRSEFLVEHAVAAVRDRPKPPLVVVEMCCGVGAIGVAVVRRLLVLGLAVRAHLADVDPAALQWARRNAAQVPGPARPRIHQGDLWSALPDDLHGRVDLVVANAPYVPTGEWAFLPPEARHHEPGLALDGGPDGVDLHRRIVAASPCWLRPGGVVVIETSRGQADLTAGVMADAGLEVRVDHDRERSATAVSGRRAGDPADGPG